MRVLGLYGSPRKKGNTEGLHDRLLQELELRGAAVKRLRVHDMDVNPCLEYTACERTGRCPIEDDMEKVVIPALRKADLVTVSSPVFFYGVPAGLKALIDRSQILWARKYRLKLRDPAAGLRRAFLLAAGATSGENLFTGIRLTAEYFFDAIDASYAGDLVYRSVEMRGDIGGVKTLSEDLRAAADDLFRETSRRILVVSPRSGASALAAAAAVREVSGIGVDVVSLGPRLAGDDRVYLDGAGRAEGLDLFSETLDYTFERTGPGGKAPEDRESGAADWTAGRYDFVVVAGAGGNAASRTESLLEECGLTGGKIVPWNPSEKGGSILASYRKAARNFVESLS